MPQVNFKTGDKITVYSKDPQEGKVHASPFQGVVIAIKGEKNNKTFTVRKESVDGVVVERIFPLNSPIIERIDLVKEGRVRRAKLYYLRRKNR